jgi:NAD(P)-dependent dehydrogenase (short-subunit alcohol dehydrogenase family)
MARVFITGSADGLGQLAAKHLVAEGHHVVLHARNDERGRQALASVPSAENVLIGDLSSIAETKALADRVNALERFDAIIHNAAVYQASGDEIFVVNTLAPYILTGLVKKPRRLVYMSSDMHEGGSPKLELFKRDTSQISYSDSKLHVLMLCKAVSRKWPDVYANAVNPGWVPTKMGGPDAPDSFDSGYLTQTWLAVSEDKAAKVSGRYFYHQKEHRYNTEADDIQLQGKFLTLCEDITGIAITSMPTRDSNAARNS